MSPSQNEAGFTLIELLVTLAIMALVSALLIPMVSSRATKAGDAPADAVMRAVAQSRHQAVRLHEEVTFPLPSGAQWQAGFPAGTLSPAFHADGSATGGSLILANGQSINISWIDGHATLAR